MGLAETVKNLLNELSPSGQITELALPQFDEIELTEDEVKESLRKGREEKYFRIRNTEYWDNARRKMQWEIPNAREILGKLQSTTGVNGLPFQVTEWNLHVIKALCLYFANDPEFEQRYPGAKLSKGIWLAGSQGTGKSHLMAFMQKNPHQSYKTITTKLIAERYAQKWSRDEMDTLEFFAKPAKSEVGHPYNQEELGYCFNDLGSEPIRKQFGNESNVMEHILFQRYENHLPFNQTHITTNLDPKGIEEAYGVRILDRMNEMMNQFVLIGPSWRK